MATEDENNARERLNAEPTAILTEAERSQINQVIGQLHAMLKGSRTLMEKLGNADPHPQWKCWFLDNAKVVGAMERKLFTFHT